MTADTLQIAPSRRAPVRRLRRYALGDQLADELANSWRWSSVAAEDESDERHVE